MTPDEQDRIIEEAAATIAARLPGLDWREHAFKDLVHPDLQRGRWTVIGTVSALGATSRQTYTVCVDFNNGERTLKKGWPPVPVRTQDH